MSGVNILGWLIVSGVFFGLFAATAVAWNFKTAGIIWAISGAIAGILCLGMTLTTR